MLEHAVAASLAVCLYGRAAMTTVEGPPAPPPRHVSEDGFKTVFVKRMEGNFHFTVNPSARPGDALTSALPSLGGGLQSL